MKKLWVPILLVCYLAFSTGIVVNYHYCMNKLASSELFGKKAKQCGKCGMGVHKSNKCCREEVQIIKMDDDQKVTSAITFELPAIDQLVSIPSVFIITSFYNAPAKRDHHNHSPPLLTGQDTYLQNCVFRI